jgi:hypothetical protein
MEEKISSLLSSPDAMDKIMSVARSLGLGAPPGGEGAPSPRRPRPEAERNPSPGTDFAPGNLDPKLVGMLATFGGIQPGRRQKAILLMR